MKIVISGIFGKMGRLVYEKLDNNGSYLVVAGIDKSVESCKIPIYKNITSVIDNIEFDCLIDFTIQPFAYETISKAIVKGKHIISGTTGWTKGQLDNIEMLSSKNDGSVIISPNFSIGIKLMNDFALFVSKYFTHAAFSEAHHEKKIDVPSGTALALYDSFVKNKHNSKDRIVVSDINSFRLPGVLATHEIILASSNQTFKIIHSANDRTAFLDGVLISLAEIEKKKVIRIGI